jgi:K+-transporting ATPase ATPase C chain
MYSRYIRPGLYLMVVMTLAVGVLYPVSITGLSHLLFPFQSHGSLQQSGGALRGSSLIGQNFSSPRYFWGRPSATTPQPNNALASGGSNLGPLNPALLDKVHSAAKELHAADPLNSAKVPVDLVSSSASGIDPDISVASAYFQADRVARERHMTGLQMRELIAQHLRLPLAGFVGEARVNVLELNLALDYSSR